MSDRREAERVAWRVEGMDCPSCAAKVERAVLRLPGVREPALNFAAERLSLTLDGTTAREAVEKAVAALGYRPRLLQEAPSTSREVPAGPACGCDHAPASGRNGEHHHGQGGHSHAAARDNHHGHAAGTGPAAPAAHAHTHGGLAHAHDHDDPTERDLPLWRSAKARLVLLLAAVAALAWLFATIIPHAEHALYLVATILVVAPFARRAWTLARYGTPFSIEALMVLAALGAAAIGAAGEAMTVVLLFAVGELLEGVAAGQARSGIRALVALMPDQATRIGTGGSAETVAAASLRPGDLVLVKPGERVPADGMVEDGQAALDESAVTGESIPVTRGPGEAVVAGSICTDAALRLRVMRIGADSTLARIARMVEEATASRGRTQRFVERFASWWTPGAMAVSAAVILLPPLLFGGEWTIWLYRGLALLLVACPCALVISVPAAVASGLSAGARRGLLVKGGAALEAMGAARTVAFDKTGTLTAGRPRLGQVVPAPGVAEDEALRLAAAVEAGSAHPLARAITEAAASRGLTVPEAREASALPGRAATARVEGRDLGVGNLGWAAEQAGPLPPALQAEAGRLQESGHTVSALAGDGTVLALLAMRDEPRPDAASALAALRRDGVETVMLTGDAPRTAAAIARELGIEARGGLSPEDKLRAISALRARGPVVMVGDGINDAPALAAATVGVAMGGGTEVALEAADAALPGARVSGIAELMALSRGTLGNIRQNVAIAVGLKAVFLVTTVIGVTGLWPAILADTGATVLVTLNALRLLRWKPPLAA